MHVCVRARACVCACVFPFPLVSQCLCVWVRWSHWMEVIHSGQSVTGSGEPLCWCGQILLLHSCKGGDPFSCASPTSINSLGKDDFGGRGEGGGAISAERVHLDWLFSALDCVRDNKTQCGERAEVGQSAELLRLQRGESWPQICPTEAGGLLTDCSPPKPCGRIGRLGLFSIPLPFPATPKGNVLQMSGKTEWDCLHGRALGIKRENGIRKRCGSVWVC